MEWSADIGGLFNVINPFNWLNYANQKENQAYQRQQDQLNRQMQYDFAQNSIKWRTEDAKRSGIHPLAALGISPSAASPVYSSSESPRADFGDMFRAQVSLVKAQTEKAEAEAEAIKDGSVPGYDGMPINPKPVDTGSPGSSFSQSGTRIRSNYIRNEKDYVEVAKEAAQDNDKVKFADIKAKLENGGVPNNEEIDFLATWLGISGATAEKGNTWFKNGMRNLADSFVNFFRDTFSNHNAIMALRKAASSNLISRKRRQRAREILKLFKEIDKQHKSFNPWR